MLWGFQMPIQEPGCFENSITDFASEVDTLFTSVQKQMAIQVELPWELASTRGVIWTWYGHDENGTKMII